MKQILLFLTFVLISIAIPAESNNTPNYYKCDNRVGGEWNYGRAPNACDADSFGDDSVIKETYPMTVFQDSAVRDIERIRYMEELEAIVRDSAVYYLKKRKPNVSSAELDWWKLAIMTTASHESYASHYRKAVDSQLKLMRGDVGHGHGMMQIDDRAHYDTINAGIAWNLITNLTYAMDIYYAEWERAPKQRCVGSAIAYEKRVRSAWSAYNGGPSQICRWTNPNSPWAANDKAFYNMLRNKTWQDFVRNPKENASIDVACLMEQRENCPLPGSGTEDLDEGVLYRLPNGDYCALGEMLLHCVQEYRDAICLNVFGELDIKTVQDISQATADQAVRKMEDRHKVCVAYDPTLHQVGDFVEAEKNIFVRQSPGGGKVGLLLTGDIVEILDFELRDVGENNRYYLIRMGALKGYIFAGSRQDQHSWTRVTNENESKASTIARAGDVIAVKNAAGINMRSTPDGTLQINIPVGVQLAVQEMLARGNNNSIYYKVSYRKKTGYIYGGQLKPSDTTESWVTRLRDISRSER